MHSNHIDKLNFGSQMKKKHFFWKMPNEENDAAGDISISHDMSSTKKNYAAGDISGSESRPSARKILVERESRQGRLLNYIR